MPKRLGSDVMCSKMPLEREVDKDGVGNRE